jgi:predicted 2-oxoglutarate/Fe(II)-dependent dioxygenase YbiX
MPVGVKVPDFNPAPDSPCICKSGQLFKDCCGTTAHDRRPPPGVFVLPGFLDRDTCRRWVDFLEQQPRASAQVLDREKSTAEESVFVEDKARVCHEVKAGDLQETINQTVRNAYLKVAAATNRNMEWMEMPHVLRYEPGGYYISHADSCQRDEATRSWYKVNDRDLSLLMYINDDFTGGGFSFTRFNCRFTPRIGDVLVFPSDHRYEHCAHVVDSGFRYAIASWAAVRGVKRVLPKPPEFAIPF